MHEEDHKIKFGRSSDVHHKHEPYRLSQNNSIENLEALCKPCHAKAEKELRQSLKQEELELMLKFSQHPERKRLSVKAYFYRFNNCPRCFGKKTKESKLCRICKDEVARENRVIKNQKLLICPLCEKKKSIKAQICWNCYLRNKKRETA